MRPEQRFAASFLVDAPLLGLRGFSLSVIGTQFLAYAAVDSLDDANKVKEILEKA